MDAKAQLPDDLNPEIVKATAIFIGKITGVVPPPHDAFPPEWHGYLRTFTSRLYEVARENAALPSDAAQAPIAWMRVTDITEWTDTEPESDGWTSLYAAPVAPAAAEMPDENSAEFNAGCAMALKASEAGIGPCGVFIAGYRALRGIATDVGEPVARAAVAPINLEGLRKKLLTPRKILRDENGWAWHGDYPVFDEGTHVDKFLAALGIKSAFVAMESDLPDFAERWHEEGLTDCSAWTPTPPEGDGWLLLAIYDTEDGPYALFCRDQYKVDNAWKRERAQLLRERFDDAIVTEGGTALSNENKQPDEREAIYEIADRIFTTRVDDEEILEFVEALRAHTAPNLTTDMLRKLVVGVREFILGFLSNHLKDGFEPYDRLRSDRVTQVLVNDVRDQIEVGHPASPRISYAARDVIAERERQVSAEGWTPEHDDQHANGELTAAAWGYLFATLNAIGKPPALVLKMTPPYWPWDESWFKPSTPRRMLEKAGALILAEIERIDRDDRKAEIERSGGDA
ncbi:hypothetical protein [Paraburkholderia bannensis]|uniref:hypothetical protein n=1 Tax=Paraburkholderia bannensis TaxID=765414 RepID=UPI002ABD77B7|nr:hypothetical protein [Paraburkholderia bannensis]